MGQSEVVAYTGPMSCIVITIGVFGTILNALVPICCHGLHNRSGIFIMHQALINVIQAIIGLVMGINLRSGKTCTFLGASYVTIVTVTLFNIAASSISEAFNFEQRISLRFVLSGWLSVFQRDSWPCIWQGLIMVWSLAIVVHLGVTLIGATDTDLFYDSTQQACILLHRDNRGYILHLMWMLCICLSLIISGIYIKKLITYMYSKKENTAPAYLLTTVVGSCTLDRNTESCEAIRRAADIQNIIQRTKASLLFLLTFSVAWMPLLVCLLVDRKFAAPGWLVAVFLTFAHLYVIWMPLSYYLLATNVIWRLSYDPCTNYYKRLGTRLMGNQFYMFELQDHEAKSTSIEEAVVPKPSDAFDIPHEDGLYHANSNGIMIYPSGGDFPSPPVSDQN